MSLFDDDYYYTPTSDFQRKILKEADKQDMHPLVLIAKMLEKNVDAMDEFTDQDPKVTKSERIAIRSDIEEAREAILKTVKIIPAEASEVDD